ncbi:MAG: hypothetical protein LWX01_04320 [Deltaproteobacteria bacterium]|nr:hypothetical protein [Deltaproteobacteria bacterium]MDL1960912.1 hypothetical protein [Deltaproteobacteria bacterium]
MKSITVHGWRFCRRGLREGEICRRRIGKEPIIRVLGHDPLEVVDKALRLADFL